jgi:hypothetical protein
MVNGQSMDDGFMDEHDVSMADFGPAPSGGLQDLGNDYDYVMSLTPQDFRGGVRTFKDMRLPDPDPNLPTRFARTMGKIPLVGPIIEWALPKSYPEILAMGLSMGASKAFGTAGKAGSAMNTAVNLMGKTNPLSNTAGPAAPNNMLAEPAPAPAPAPVSPITIDRGLPSPDPGLVAMLGPPSAPSAPVAVAAMPPEIAMALPSRSNNVATPAAPAAPMAPPISTPSPAARAARDVASVAPTARGASPAPTLNLSPMERSDVTVAAAPPPDQPASDYIGGSTGQFIDKGLDNFYDFLTKDTPQAIADLLTPQAAPKTMAQVSPTTKGQKGTGGQRDPDPETNDPEPPMMPLSTTPAAPAPVAEGPSFAAAPTTGLMALPPGFDPTQAGYTYTNFARTAQRGGLMDLPNQARNVAAQGRGGDTMLVHMRPDEVAGLQALGGVTRNPQTGLPENFMGSLLGSLAGLAFAPFTGGASFFSNPFVMQGLGSGIGQFAESKIRGDQNALQKGLTSGLLAGLGSYGLNKLGSAATTAGKDGFFAGAQNYFPEKLTAGQLPGGDALMGAAGLGLGSGAVTDMMMPFVPPIKTPGEFKKTAKLDPRYQRMAREDLSGVDLTNYGQGPERRFFSTQRFQEGGLTEVGAMMQEAGPDADIVAQEVTAQAVSAVRGDHPEPEKAITEYISMFGEESFGRLREMVIQEMQVESVGGAEEIAAEGMISGPGAGRDDLIRGSIEGEQELRVSDGEFIIPADVVSGIGDGSSDAGAKRLYQMLDRVRQTRTGTKQQPSRVDEQAMLPA